MQHLIDNLQCKVPLLIVLVTLFLTELLYLLGLPLIFDFYSSFKVLLDLVIVCQIMFLIIMRNQLRKLQLQSSVLRLTNKMTPEQFIMHTRQTTEQELAKLTQTEEFRQFQQRPYMTSPKLESLTEDDSISEDDSYPLTSHQLATKKKLF